jgi:hypothetical protein
MVMIFAVKEAREQLLNKGVVITFRAYRENHENLGKKDWATDKRCGKKICDIYVALLENCAGENMTSVGDLAPYLPLSGFKCMAEWDEAINLVNHTKENPLVWGEAFIVFNLDFKASVGGGKLK